MPGLSAALTDRGSLPHGFPLFLEYLFSTDNMQLGLKTFSPISPTQPRLGCSGELRSLSVFIFHPPFIVTSFVILFFLGGGGVIVNFISVSYLFAFPPNPPHELLPSGGPAQLALGTRERTDSGPPQLSLPCLWKGGWGSGASSCALGEAWPLLPTLALDCYSKLWEIFTLIDRKSVV